MGRETWLATVHGVNKLDTIEHTHTHTDQKRITQIRKRWNMKSHGTRGLGVGVPLENLQCILTSS